MKSNAQNIENLAANVIREQDAILDARSNDASANDEAKRRLRSAASKSKSNFAPGPTPAKVAALVAIAAAILLVIGAAVVRSRPKPLAFRIGDAPGDGGGGVRASADAPVDLHFSDASAITIDASGRARVVDVDANGARVVLESGVAHVAITHRDASRWHIIAGPFDVVVTGTQFDVAWEPATEHFSVHMKQGTVHVLGTLLGEGHALSSGEALEVSLSDRVVHQTDASTATNLDAPTPDLAASAQVDSPNAAALLSPDARADTGIDLPVDVAPKASATPAWAIFARRAEYQQAVETAEKSGFGKACDQAKLSDLLALGDAARFTGHTGEAREAYAAVRSRSPNDPASAEAAFDLGRVAFDREHDFAAAAKWFDTYGRERPNGPLAREAAGRLIEARQRAGDRIGLEAAAQSYLQKYPDGPHADLARSIVTP
jgi:transmembrane sensor